MNKYLIKDIEDQAIEWLIRLESPSVSEQQVDDFMRWIECSPLHQAAYLKAEKLSQSGANFAKLCPVATVEGENWRSYLNKNIGIWHSAALACFALLAMIGLFIGGPAKDDNIHQIYSTIIGQQQDVILDDGSSVILNTDTEIEYVAEKDRRIAYLNKGEAIFSVHPDSRRPFYVMTASGAVKVVGTVFSVKVVPQDAIVTVSQGKVSLGSMQDERKSFEAKTLITKNQQMSLSAAHNGKPYQSVDAQSAMLWKNKRLSYVNATLNEVAFDIGRYFQQKIVIEDPELGETKIVAVVELSNFEKIVADLSELLNLRVEFSHDAQQAILHK